jgi:hypothetical protein
MRAAQVEVICCHKCHEGLLVLAGVPAVTFGPPGTGAADAGGASDDRSRDALERRRRYRARLHYRLLQHHSREMAAGESYWAAALNLSNYRSSQADITDDSGAGGLAGFGRIAPDGGGGGGPAPPSIFPVTLFAVSIVLAVGGGALYWHHTSKGEVPPPVSHVRSEFESVSLSCSPAY